jgi:cyclic pyranopterin phosphate synthase
MTNDRIQDLLQRPMGSLRLSVTDRCNLRCGYCMPEASYTWLPRQDILTFEELTRLARIFSHLGVKRLRLTGGEPLLRQSLHELITMLKDIGGIADLAMTTNGLLLARQADALKDAGLNRLTVSLDSLEADRFSRLTRGGNLSHAIEGIQAVGRLGFKGTKINMVVMAGVNDNELVPMLRFGQEEGIEIRFIEYMDVGGATDWTMNDVVSRDAMLASITSQLGPIEVLDEGGRAPARRYRTAEGQVFGIIASTTAPFCGDCDRSRITADGRWLTCLYDPTGLDMRTHLRSADDDETIHGVIKTHWQARRDQGAVERLNHAQRGQWVSVEALRQNPHLEMHTRGG